MIPVICLMPDHKINLTVYADDFFDAHDYPPLKRGRRFKQMFLATWKRLPLAVRRALLTYWKPQLSRLRVELTSTGLDDHLIASCADQGFALLFKPLVLLDAEARSIETIAHELAHAYRYVTGVAYLGEATVASEIETRRLAQSWGFKQTPFLTSDYRKEIALDKKLAAFKQSKK